jgi:putative transposase
MKRTRYTDEQIVFALRQAETGTSVQEVIRKMGISEATFYNWKKIYGGLGHSEVPIIMTIISAVDFLFQDSMFNGLIIA